MVNKEKGFIYIAYGEKFLLEAVFSAQTLRNNVPNADITLFTEEVSKSFRERLNIFDQIIEKKMENSYIDKPICMKNTPYYRTIFLDSDTCVCEDISSLFNLLNYFDIAAVLSPNYPLGPKWDPELVNLPEYNTGMILYRNNENINNFFDEWEKTYRERKHLDAHDQPSMSLALARSSVRMINLPFEFNFLFNHSSILWENVKILHGRTRSYKKILSRLNRRDNCKIIRCWSPAHKRCFCDEGSGLRKFALRTRKFLAPYFQPVRDRLKLHGDLIMPKKERFKR